MSDLTIQHAGSTITAPDGADSQSARIIRVTPTLVPGDPTAYGAADVLVNPTEIPKAVNTRGGCSELVGISILDQADQGVDMDIIFMQVAKDLGTENAVVDISDDNAQAAKFIGSVKVDFSQGLVSLVDSKFCSVKSYRSETASNPFPMLLQAEANSTSVYFGVIILSLIHI